MDIASITRVSTDGPTKFAMHSVEGLGKTTIAAAFPRPVFVAPERGFPRDLPAAPEAFPEPKTWADVLACVETLIASEHAFRTVAFDTVDWIEPLIHRYVCERDSGRKTEMNAAGRKLESIEDYGYGKGYVAAAEEFRRLIALLDRLQVERGMHVVMLMHSQVKNFRNPAGEDFDRWQPKMHDKIARVVIEWCETVLFGYFEVETSKKEKDPKAKGFSTGRRLLGARQSAMYDAKNRLGLPDVIELGPPEQLVPYLLGRHVVKRVAGEAVADAAPERTKPAAIVAPAPKPDRALADEVVAAVKRGEAALDAATNKKVQRWLVGAGADPDKLRHVIRAIDDAIANTTKGAAPAA